MNFRQSLIFYQSFFRKKINDYSFSDSTESKIEDEIEKLTANQTESLTENYTVN